MATEPKPRLHPNLAEVCHQEVALHQALRALVEAIVLMPRQRPAGDRGQGDLAAILALGASASTRHEGRLHEAC